MLRPRRAHSALAKSVVAFLAREAHAVEMKASVLAIVVAAACVLPVEAQYKGPRDYFPKNNPAPFNNGQGGARNGGQPNARNAPNKQQPDKPQQPKFKDVAVNSQFYFQSDTNHAFAWIKISSLSASNVQNGLVRTISGETPVQK